MPNTRLTLAIETSNPSAAKADAGPAVALGRVGHGEPDVLGVEPLRSRDRHDDDLLPAIDRLWSRLDPGPDRCEIDLVAVSIGPGGYTGIRIAVVAAKLIAEVAGALCVGVPSAWALARRVPADLPRPFGVALASKGATTVVTGFGSSEGPAGDPAEVDADGLGALGLQGLVADRFLPEAIRRRAVELGLRIVEPRFDPVAVLELASRLEAVDPAALAPLYGREPEAVRKWRELHGPRGG
ncbi:MAG: hypothetical protein IPJ41_17725 [Phycisphaerales bacterium]|nr:hypothetical protein [Phycisphaerales bacterium]